MTGYQFWCPQCNKGFHEHELEQREVDTMFGDGRWWWCRACSSEVRYDAGVFKDQTMKNHWDPEALAEEMRESTKLVSAFFLIDSLESISRCIEWLALLKPYGMPDMEYSQYFLNIRQIYQVGGEARQARSMLTHLRFMHSFQPLFVREGIDKIVWTS